MAGSPLTSSSKIRRVRWDVDAIRSDFPILSRKIYGKPLVYFDNAATTHKPQAVIDAITGFYSEYNSNIHRGVHFLSQQATQMYEDVRVQVKDFLGASRAEEIIFLRGTTEAINLVARSFVKPRLAEGDEIIVSGMEHHSGIVPYQMICQETGAKLLAIPVNDRGELDFNAYLALLGPRTKFVNIVHVSNALGTVNPVKAMTEAAHRVGAEVMIDGAQAAGHYPLDVRDLGCDFYAFSGHKVYGPTGIGALYGKYDLLDEMPPYQGGGEMILSVTFEDVVYNKVPNKFEAGTPNIAGVLGLGAALRYLTSLDREAALDHENELLRHATERVGEIDQLRIIGAARDKSSILGFVLDDIHPHDIGTILDQEGIAVRAGHHCAQPVMNRFQVPATVRASFALYNTKAEIDHLIDALFKVREVFS